MKPIACFSSLALTCMAAPANAFPYRDYAQPLTNTLRLYQTERIIKLRERMGRPITQSDWNQYTVCQRLIAFTGYDRDCNQFLY